MNYTIITVTYNCASTIERTIKSVLSQNYSAYEYIVIDGDSSDGTTQIIEKYRDKLSYYVSEPDSGMYEAMNKGLKHATGDLVLFLNGDDYLADNTVLLRMAQHYVDEKTVVIGRLYQGDKLSPDNTNADFKSKYYGIFYPHQATFVPKVLYDRLGGFDESYRVSADFEWICRAMYNGYQVKWVDEIVSFFSLGGLSSTLQCQIDEYNISKKYMEMTDDSYVEDMTNRTIDVTRSFFFRKMLMDEQYLQYIEKALNKVGVNRGDTIQIWGAGAWLELFINAFTYAGIKVNYIFDSNGSKRSFSEIPIVSFDKRKVSRLFISTEYYDDEIGELLCKEGFAENTDYVKFHFFRNVFLQYYDKTGCCYKDFEKQTKIQPF